MQMDYRIRFLSRWAIDGANREEASQIEAERQRQLRAIKQADEEVLALRAATIEADAAIVAEDKLVTSQIQSMMVKYGMIGFDIPPSELAEDRLDYLLETGNSLQRQKVQANY
jgi:hypothetical protein